MPTSVTSPRFPDFSVVMETDSGPPTQPRVHPAQLGLHPPLTPRSLWTQQQQQYRHPEEEAQHCAGAPPRRTHSAGTGTARRDSAASGTRPSGLSKEL